MVNGTIPFAHTLHRLLFSLFRRQPLARKAVEPVDIYRPPVQAEAEKPQVTPEPVNSVPKTEQGTPQKPAPQPTTPKKDDALKPYSTYLYPSQVKGVKLRAIEQDVNDFAIVQEAINDYFKKHPL